MANKFIFDSAARKIQEADTINEAGGKAYKFSNKHALAQYAATGCINNTFYATGEDQMNKVLEFCKDVPAEFIAKTAIYCREKSFMKDMPALLASILSTKDLGLLTKIFPRVIDNGKMLRNYVQIIRSGLVGRKSFGSRPRKLVHGWFKSRTPDRIFKESVGTNPSLADIIKLTRPKPETSEKEALYRYLIGKQTDNAKLPPLVQSFEAFKKNEGEIPDVPFQMLTALKLTDEHWRKIAEHGGWHMVRMNLNTFARHNVFENKGMTKLISSKLVDKEAIKKSKVFPYQLMVAYKNLNPQIPQAIGNALQEAMEIATENVPTFPGKTFVFVDVSGSMSSAVTGYRKGSTSQVSCVDVAALIAATVIRVNDEAEVVIFDTTAKKIRLNPKDSVMTNAQKLARNGGGTNCSAPMQLVNQHKEKADQIIYVSDNQSWADFSSNGTQSMEEWIEFKERSPKAKLVCIDLQPYAHTQLPDSEDVLNVGGFNDNVFEAVQAFTSKKAHWVDIIEGVEL